MQHEQTCTHILYLDKTNDVLQEDTSQHLDVLHLKTSELDGDTLKTGQVEAP